MKKLEPILLVILALVLVFVVYSMVKGPSYTPSQTTPTVENLNSDLQSLNSTDLDTGADSQLDQLSTDSFSF